MASTKMNERDLHEVFRLGRSNRWAEVLRIIHTSPELALFPIVMRNNLSTTIIHQAITSKGDVEQRTNLILTILRNTPQAAAMKNGYGSLPLHVIGQRNTKLDSQSKEKLITELVNAYPDAVVEQGGVGKRTPLHILFTDYLSPAVAQMMIDKGPMACFIKDRKGYLPIHVACSRHCSPEKLLMLMSVNPESILATTADGLTILELAKLSKTASHPNQALIEEIQRWLIQYRQSPIIFQRKMQDLYVSLRAKSGGATSTVPRKQVANENVKRYQLHDFTNGNLDLEYSIDSAAITDSSDDTPPPPPPPYMTQRSYPLQLDCYNPVMEEETRYFTPVMQTRRVCEIFRKSNVNDTVGCVQHSRIYRNARPSTSSSSTIGSSRINLFADRAPEPYNAATAAAAVTPHVLYSNCSQSHNSNGISAFTSCRGYSNSSMRLNLRPVRLFHDSVAHVDLKNSANYIPATPCNRRSIIRNIPNGSRGTDSNVSTCTTTTTTTTTPIRGIRSEQSSPAHLLLHFSQSVSSRTAVDSPKRKRDIAEV